MPPMMWYESAANEPIVMILPMTPCMSDFANSNPSADCRDNAHVTITKIKAKKKATPVTRCRIEAFAVGGIEIVVRSRFTGLCFFTFTCLSELFIFVMRCTLGHTPTRLQFD